MRGNFKGFILTVLCTVMLCHFAMAQSHFMYIQSERGTPFYIKMNDSLLSSTQSGYLILHRLEKGTYPIIIGFAKKKIPEAAFQITMDGSGDKGYMLKSVGGALRLVNVQNHKILQPAEVATSAGNRILPSTLADIAEQPQTHTTEQPLATNTDSQPASGAPEANPPAESQANSFEDMLNAVTGDTSPSPSAAEKPDVKPETPALKPEKPLTEEAPLITDASAPEEKSIPEEKKETPSFYDLINPDKNKKTIKTPAPPKPVTTEPSAPVVESPQTTSPDLTFIDFSTAKKTNSRQPDVQNEDDLYNDTIITSGKELRQWKKQQRRLAKQQDNRPDSGSLFDALLEKVDTATSDSAASPSVAYPLFGDKEDRQGTTATTESVVCNETADKRYFSKVRRKVASKKSEQAMLRAATRYLSGDKCFTLSQIRQLAYLFATDHYRLQFLQAAYLHCSQKNRYEALIKTLSGSRYQNRLKAYIR